MLTGGYPSGPQVLAAAVNCPEEAGLALLRREARITMRFWSFGLVDRGKHEGKHGKTLRDHDQKPWFPDVSG